MGSDPARAPQQRAPAEPSKKRSTSGGLLGSMRRHVRLSGTGIRPRIKKRAPLPIHEQIITAVFAAPPA